MFSGAAVAEVIGIFCFLCMTDSEIENVLFLVASGPAVLTEIVVLHPTHHEDIGDPGFHCQWYQQGMDGMET